MDFCQSLISNSNIITTWIQSFAALASVTLLFKGYLIAKNFRNEHKEKIRIEREHRFAEKILELMKKIDLEMNSLFDTKILETQEGRHEVQRINQLTDPCTLQGITKIRYYYLRHIAVKLNKPHKWPLILSIFREMELFIEYFESKSMSESKVRMIFACKAIIEWIEDTFLILANEKFGTLDEYLQHFEINIIHNFPDTMLVKSPFIDRYQKYRDKLTKEVFNILKGNKR
ncbi:hypothetical protein [Algoriphagus sp. CAU 1675]|uniref:hypothetical protein n=1 Tax=Algoriphagus sp. CAU 1675 TaxID=3032597 RepID=UPI0023D9D852|nr:hypothetical protein [Algoriphagus sp. CAU 1675]MDF2157290.1 hypothetical protein [Algoriphagus sp. CAU 1675]